MASGVRLERSGVAGASYSSSSPVAAGRSYHQSPSVRASSSTLNRTVAGAAAAVRRRTGS
ncbi:hypothetical protein [Streptomyces sp. NPDC051310]|uniref:hypothetical protein n=1 Tax=Streptomyces sp. NPDC051310 TaxID=3365649 RepID=UPI00378D4156